MMNTIMKHLNQNRISKQSGGGMVDAKKESQS